MEFEQHNMYRRIHGVKSSVDTKLVRHTYAGPKSAAAQRAESDAFHEVRETARRINDLSLKKRSGGDDVHVSTEIYGSVKAAERKQSGASFGGPDRGVSREASGEHAPTNRRATQLGGT